MHPIFEQPRRLAFYLFLALQAGLLLAELLVRSAEVPRLEATLLAVPLLLAHAFSCLASWYLCRILPLGSTQAERLLGTHLVAGLLASALATGLGTFLAEVLEDLLQASALTETFLRVRTLVFVYALLVFTLAVAVHYLFLAAEGRQAAERRAYELRLLAREAELDALKAQIDPHFLFNSLHSINSLVTADPAKARTMCQGLADLLRLSLRFGARQSIPFSEEMALAERYLEVERIRFGARLQVETEVEEVCAACAVPPLLLQPLVENAIRHGIGHLLDGGTVGIRARREGETLRIEVENPCDEERPASRGEGIGLTNVRRRLKAAYGDDVSFSARETPATGGCTEGRFRVVLTLPCRDVSKGEEIS